MSFVEGPVYICDGCGVAQPTKPPHILPPAWKRQHLEDDGTPRELCPACVAKARAGKEQKKTGRKKKG